MAGPMGMTEALKKAKRYPVPTSKEQYVRFTSIEVFCAYLKLHNFRFVRFNGDMAIVAPIENPSEEQAKQKEPLVTA